MVGNMFVFITMVGNIFVFITDDNAGVIYNMTVELNKTFDDLLHTELSDTSSAVKLLKVHCGINTNFVLKTF